MTDHQCIKPLIHKDEWRTIFICGDPENCSEYFNETRPDHHYGCECGDCEHDYWMLKQ